MSGQFTPSPKATVAMTIRKQEHEENCFSMMSLTLASVQPVKQSTSLNSGIFRGHPGGSVISPPKQVQNSTHNCAQSIGRRQNISVRSSIVLFSFNSFINGLNEASSDSKFITVKYKLLFSGEISITTGSIIPRVLIICFCSTVVAVAVRATTQACFGNRLPVERTLVDSLVPYSMLLPINYIVMDMECVPIQ